MLTCKISQLIVDKTILNDVEFTLERGRHLLILGESGSGKTTLLSILAGLLKPSKGNVLYERQDIYALSSAALDDFRGKHIGIIFQELHLISALSVMDNLQVINQQEDGETRITQLLARLGLAGKEHQRTESLSVGERQRLAIARALINKPSIVFADEPTSALDDKNTASMLELLQSHASDAGASLIITTHDKRVKDAFSNQQILELGGK